MNTEIKYPVGIQNFSKIREYGFLYVDKTASMFPIIKQGGYYFLSRPRRFGKSLLLSTLEAFYKGRHDLFKGLAIDSLTDDWTPHPVLHLDLNYGSYRSPQDLDEILDDHLRIWESEFGQVNSESEDKVVSPSIRFNRIIRNAFEKTGRKVVILVDEYDKPLLNTIHDPELSDLYRSQLKAFYSNLKTMDPYIELAILTGVARFSKVSIFSDLNNLNDISFDKRFAAICGITADELDEYFSEGIRNMAEEMALSPLEVRELLRKRYDGYHFSEVSPDIYNPFSLVNAFSKNAMDDYWFASGTPSYLVSLIRNGRIQPREIAPITIDREKLITAGLLNANPIPAFYQSGYLTIKGFDMEFNEFILDYPNEEVKRGFLDFLLDSYFPQIENRRGFSIPDFVRDVRAGKPEAFMKRMESLIAAIPYNGKGSAEDHFQNAVYLLFNLMGFYAKMEDRTSDGRIDLQVESHDCIFIFEFKIDSSARVAMDQILEKRYWLRENAGNRRIFLIGANFDTKTRRLTETLIEKVKD